MFMFKDEMNKKESEESEKAFSQDEEPEEAESGDTPKEAKLSLNAITGIFKTTSMWLIA